MATSTNMLYGVTNFPSSVSPITQVNSLLALKSIASQLIEDSNCTEQ